MRFKENLQGSRGQRTENTAGGRPGLRQAQDDGAHQANPSARKFFLSMGDRMRAMAPSFLSFSFPSICDPPETQQVNDNNSTTITFQDFSHLFQETFWNDAVVDGCHFGDQPFGLARLPSAQQPPGRLQNAPGKERAASLSNPRRTPRTPEAENMKNKNNTKPHHI